jgi:hypothetical protein
MIFATENAIKHIMSGRKTQTRRRIKDGEWRWVVLAPVETYTVYYYNADKKKSIRYQSGKTYAVQPGRGKKAVGRIRITSIWKEPVNAISEADAIAEGFASRDEFLDVWKGLYGEDTDMNAQCWVLSFEVCDG